jgi:EAL domain-containing protein (putative c-di-GMP-specific phosphodiesterase class I)
MEASQWPEEIFISVNLSPIQMRDPRLLSTIFMALSASGVAPHRVELEITESVLMTDSEENLAILHKIRDLGVKIALDDFGTGYSSLSYLRSFPFDKIKIDRCFITDLAEKSDSQAIVTAVIRLAEELGMCTLAEGVENIEQLERLRTTGCEQVQGFLFSRARPANELEHHRGRRVTQVSRASVTPFRKGDVAEPAEPLVNMNRAAV